MDFIRQWKRVNWELHSAVGIWTVALVAMWAVTGVYFAFPAAFRSAVNRISPVAVVRPPQSDPSGPLQSARPTWRGLVDGAHRRAPGEHVARLVFPSSENSGVSRDVFPRPADTGREPQSSRPSISTGTGAVLTQPPATRRTAGDLVMAWVAPLHVGNSVATWWESPGSSSASHPGSCSSPGSSCGGRPCVRPRWIRLSQPAAEAARW